MDVDGFLEVYGRVAEDAEKEDGDGGWDEDGSTAIDITLWDGVTDSVGEGSVTGETLADD